MRIIIGTMTNRRSTTRPPRSAQAIGFDDRLLAEAVSAYEQGGTQRVALSNEQQETPGGSFETVLVNRAAGLQIAGTLRASLGRVRRWIRATCICFLIVGLVVGGTLAGAMLTGQAALPVNFYWLLFAAFGIQLAALLLWMVLSIIPGLGTSSAWLGHATLATSEWLCRRAHLGKPTIAAVRAWFAVLRHPTLARWSLGILTHGIWLAANVSFLVIVLVLLSARSYTFHWQTTILSDSVFVDLTRAVAWLPEKLGLAAPSHEQILACGPGATRQALADARTAWAGLLTGSIVVYGILPRAALLILSLFAWRIGRPRYRLDVERFARGYGDLRPTIHAGTRGVTSPADPGLDDDIQALAIDRPEPQTKRRPHGKPALIGVELPHPLPVDTRFYGGWKPAVNIDGRQDRDALLSELANAPTEPSAVLLVFDIGTTPDTGHASFVIEVRSCVTHPARAVLSGGAQLALDMAGRDEIQAQQQRVRQWRELLEQAGVRPDDIVCLDMEHMTAFSRTVLMRHADHTAHEQHPSERFAWWRAAQQTINAWVQNGASSGDEFAAMISEMDAAFGCDPANCTNRAVQRGNEIIDRAGATVSTARTHAHEAADAARHPLRTIARRAVRSAVPVRNAAVKKKGGVDDLTFAAMGECIAHAMHLDLQGRCDQPMTTRVIEKVLAQVNAELNSPAEVMQHWCDAYETLCVAEGLA